ncbi:MAG TPA: hypothetical protein VF587_20520 [Solirubrobacteraceae bacterium]
MVDLDYLLQVCGGAGTALGGFVGFFVRAPTGRQIIENVLRWGAFGGIIGLMVAFALWGAFELNEAASR